MQVHVVLTSGVIAWLAVSFVLTASAMAYVVSYLNRGDE